MSRWLIAKTRRGLPNKSGLYAIYNNKTKELLYIGSSTNLYNRINHRDYSYGFCKVASDIGIDNLMIKYKITNWLLTEKLLIRRLCPKYNQNYTGKKMRRTCITPYKKKKRMDRTL